MKKLLLSFLILSACLTAFGQGKNFQPRVAMTNSLAGVAPNPDVLWYKFNEGSGTNLTDSSITSTNAGTNNHFWVTRGSGSSALFNGFMMAKPTNTLNFLTNFLTISFWLNPSNVTSECVLMESSANAPANNGAFYITVSSNLFSVLHHGSTGNRIETNAAPSSNVWAHYVVTLESTSVNDVRVWKDGVEQTMGIQQNTRTDFSDFSTQPLFIASRSPNNTVTYKGFLNDFRIWRGDQSTYVSTIFSDEQ